MITRGRSKPEILFLAHRMPYPPDKGDKIRSWRLLNHLAQRFDVHLACFVDDKADFAHRRHVEKVCASATLIALDPTKAKLKSVAGLLKGEALSFAYYRDREMVKAVDQLRARALCAEIAFSSSMAPYLEPAHQNRPRIIDLCDADSEKWRQYSKETSFPMAWVYGREGRLLAKAETAMINRADISFAISPAEAALLNKRSNIKRKAAWFGNGVDADYFAPQDPREDGADIVFTGAMDYKANVDAVLWFADYVWPRLLKEKPELKFAIVGARPDAKVKKLDRRTGVTVSGRVDDIRPYIASAKVAVAPLQIARGVQNKVLEAMAMGKPVVATSGAAEGIAAIPGVELIVADQADAFANEVTDLLYNAEKRAGLGAAARALMINNYSWPAQLARFDAALSDAGVQLP